MEYLDYGQMVVQFREIFIEKNYGFHCENPAPCIVDCGGNIGMSALWFKLNHPNCHLTVYEADPAIAKVLQRNVANAKVKGEVDIRNKAAWICDTNVWFEARGNDSGRISEGGSVLVPATNIVRELPPTVDLLKLDIEGAEFAVLDHLCNSGAIERIEAMVVEFHVWRDRTDDMLRALTNLRAAGMEICFRSAPCPWIGLAASKAPFTEIGDFHMLMMIYAWRNRTVQHCSPPASISQSPTFA